MANVTVLFLILRHNATISRLNRIGRQLQMVELTAGEIGSELAVLYLQSLLHFHPSTKLPRNTRGNLIRGKTGTFQKKILEGLRWIYR